MKEQIVLKLDGMSCHACAALIQDELSDAPGVQSAAVSFEQKQAVVQFESDQTTPLELVSVVTNLGYQAVTA
jgi:copper chaperone CopZ